MRSDKMKKRNKAKWKKRLAAVVVLSGIAVIGTYVFLDYMSQTRVFPTGSNVNGVSCQGLNPEQVERKLTRIWNSRKVEIIKDGTAVESIEHLNMKYDVKEELERLLKPGFKNFVNNYILSENEKIKIDMIVKEEGENFENEVLALNVLKQKKGSYEESKDAYVSLANRKFRIIPEHYGTEIDPYRFKRAVINNIMKNRFRIEFVPSRYYRIPKIRKNSSQLLKYRAFCKKYLVQRIVYSSQGKSYEIPVKSLAEMKKMRKDGEFTIDVRAVKRFVKRVSSHFNTLGMARKFKTHSGKKITVFGGDYGFLVSKKKERKELIKNLKSGNRVVREPVYVQREREGTSRGGIGSTYVEININAQHLWYIKNGRKVLSSPVVTGSPRVGKETAPGVYSLTYKARNIKLRGVNRDGSRYESPVKFWMPFNGNIGMHDAPWRHRFGPGTYPYAGSHGCVNMPPSKAARLYKLISEEDPIVVYKF